MTCPRLVLFILKDEVVSPSMEIRGIFLQEIQEDASEVLRFLCVHICFFSPFADFCFSPSSLKGRGFRISLQTDFRALEMEEGSNLHDGAMSSAESAGIILQPMIPPQPLRTR